MRLHRRAPVALLSALIVLTVAAPAVAAPTAPPADRPAVTSALTSGQIRITQAAGGLSAPVGLANAGDGTDRLFIVEQRGTVRVFDNNELQAGLFLDIRGVAGGFSNSGERGLLSIAFHPDFETNHKLFAYYTDGGGDLVITELTANGSNTSVSASTADPIMEIEHSTYSNHNGGQLLFGPDENLYIFTGDGGSGGDPFENGQDTDSQLGKVLRVTPNLEGGRSIPADNPFVGGGGNAAVWDYGLRNPWRASFDRANGVLWIADVGQGDWEEVNRENPTTNGGVNYGWDCREGRHPFENAGCDTTQPWPYTDPVAEYANGNGNCAVTGGFVYRGGVFEDLIGKYVFADYCSGRIWNLNATSDPNDYTLQFHRDTSALITSFGETEKGELYLTDHGGRLYRVVAPPYSDVTDHSLIDHIMWITYADISTGCGGGRFCPNDAVTRAQMAAFLARALDLPGTAEDFFDDDDGHALEISINRVAAAGIASGCGERRYCPERAVTRAEMATFLDRALDLPAASQDYFTDDTGSIHEDSINAVREAGIAFGCTGTQFCPTAPTTRAEMSAFLHRAIGD